MKCKILSLLESLNHNRRPVWKKVPGLQNPEGCERRSEEELLCSYPQAANNGLTLGVTPVCISPVQTKGLKAFSIQGSHASLFCPYSVFVSESVLHTVVKNRLMRCDSAMFGEGLVEKNVFGVLTSYLDSVMVKKGTT